MPFEKKQFMKVKPEFIYKEAFFDSHISQNFAILWTNLNEKLLFMIFKRIKSHNWIDLNTHPYIEWRKSYYNYNFEANVIRYVNKEQVEVLKKKLMELVQRVGAQTNILQKQLVQKLKELKQAQELKKKSEKQVKKPDSGKEVKKEVAKEEKIPIEVENEVIEPAKTELTNKKKKAKTDVS